MICVVTQLRRNEDSRVKAKRWLTGPAVPEAAQEEFSRALEVLPLTASILLRRGLADVAAAKKFLDPTGSRLLDPSLLPGADAAGELLADAIRQGKLVVVYGDYDVDGITSAALLEEFILGQGGHCRVLLPNRLTDGYGLNARLVRTLPELGAGLLVTVDCGITAVAEVELARAGGLPVVITDHHEPGPVLPVAEAVVNPKLSGPEAFRDLAGVGVALQVVRTAAGRLGHRDHEFLRPSLDLVALGTVADVVPLQGENRALTRSGLAVLNRTNRPGLEALLRVSGLERGRLTAADVAFRLAPRLNAAGRLGDARHSLALLLTRDADEAQHLAQALQTENVRRQGLEQTVWKEALAQVESQSGLTSSVVACGREWPVGVLGLVASKLCERFHRPAFVLTEHQGRLRGSGRSIPGFPLQKVLAELAGGLETWGGHELAAGVTLAPERLEDFRTGLRLQADRRLTPEQLVPELAIDAEAGLEEITPRLVQELKRLEPFGCGNLRPLLALSDVSLASPPRVVGEHHLKLKLTDGRRHFLDAIGFGLASRAEELNALPTLDVAGHPGENTWNGSTSLQFELKDFHAHAALEARGPLSVGNHNG
jgi:single-stranded-DNA-specific exonuclease